MPVSATFHTASTFWRPVKPPKFTWWLTSGAGCARWPSNSAIFWLPMKYCQLAVAWRAVWCQVKVCVVPTGVTRQPLPSSSSSANWLFPPLQLLRPFGPSTLWGSYLI